MEKSKDYVQKFQGTYFDKHFEKFINNDISIRHYFKCKVADLKRDYPTVFTSIRKTTGIKLVNDEPETINKAKEILYNVYLLKQSQGQGRTLSDNFKVLKDDKLVEIMKDRSLTFGERCEKVNNIVKGVKETENQLTYKQIEQYIYRNYSDYKYVKTMKSGNVNEPQIIPESSEENQSEIIPESSEEIKEELELKQELKQEPKTKGKFKEFKTDEIVKLLEQHTSKVAFKILNERFKNIYTETQIRNYIARYKMKSGN